VICATTPSLAWRSFISGDCSARTVSARGVMTLSRGILDDTEMLT